MLETTALTVLDRDAESETRELAGALDATTDVEEEAALKLLVEVSPGAEEESDEEDGTATLSDVEASVDDATSVELDSPYTDEDAGVVDDSGVGVKLDSTDEVGVGDGVGSLEDVTTVPTGQSAS